MNQSQEKLTKFFEGEEDIFQHFNKCWEHTNEEVESKKYILGEEDINKCWEHINEEAERNTISRINWKLIFGHTLTEHITKLKENNPDKMSKDVYEIIKKELAELQIDDIEILRRIRISVSSRYVEQTTYNRRRKIL